MSSRSSFFFPFSSMAEQHWAERESSQARAFSTRRASGRSEAQRLYSAPAPCTIAAEKMGSMPLVKGRKPLPQERTPDARSWVAIQPRRGFHGYPIATVAFYGPTNKRATKIVVRIILSENNQPDLLERWFSHDDLDVRQDPHRWRTSPGFLQSSRSRLHWVVGRIIGCPHEEGTDYLDGTTGPQCPYWAGRDRFTHQRIQ